MNTIFLSSTDDNLFFGITRIIWQHTSTTMERLFGLFWLVFFFSMKKRSFIHVTNIWTRESHWPRAHLSIPTLPFPCQPSKIPQSTTSSWLFSQKLQQSYKNNGEVCFTQSKCFAASNVNILINGVLVFVWGIFFNSLLPYLCSHSHNAIRTEAALNFYNREEERNTT